MYSHPSKKAKGNWQYNLVVEMAVIRNRAVVSSAISSLDAAGAWSAPPPPRRCHEAPSRFHGGYNCHHYDVTHAMLYLPRGLNKPQIGPGWPWQCFMAHPPPDSPWPGLPPDPHLATPARRMCEFPSSGIPSSRQYAALWVFPHLASVHRRGSVSVSRCISSATHGKFGARATASATNSVCASARRCRTWSICTADPSRTEWFYAKTPIRARAPLGR
jgi:hypothetical protein